MNARAYDKLTIGDIAYRYPSTDLKEGNVGVVKEIHHNGGGDAPHIELAFLDGKTAIFDYNEVGGVGPARDFNGGPAIVKILFDPVFYRDSSHSRGKPPRELQHKEWPILKVAGWQDERNDLRFALIRDEFSHRLHWLAKGSEYTFVVSENKDPLAHRVILEGIPVDV